MADTTETSPNVPALDKTYAPAAHEPRVWQRWLDARAFHADPARVLNGEADPYCILIPPPNVTAALHLGHALNNTIQDILIRAHRMKGYETLWMPGTDHAGIATQTVVDKRLRAEGKPALAEHKQMEAAGEPGREKFVSLVQSWKDEYEARITDQLKQMGCSCDYERQRFTMDAICARAVREAFFQLFKAGLIYRGKRLVNWDPVTQTALSDDEVENKDVEGAFYYMRYPLVHPAEPSDHNPVTWGELTARGYPGAENHPDDDEAWITVATTRPETYLGDVAVAINPKDPRAASLRGFRCELPLVGRVIPIIEDDYVVLPIAFGGEEGDPKAEFATGFLKVTPAHDNNDYELGHRHKDRIERECSAGTILINVMAPDASISNTHGWPDYDKYGVNPGCEVFLGLSREDARKKVVKEFQAHSLNNQPLLEEIKPHQHSVGHSYRSHAAVEYYLSDQWYCKVTDDRLRGAAQRAMIPEQRTKTSLEAWPESAPTSIPTPPSGTGFQPVSPSPTSPSSPHTIPDTLTIHLPHWQRGGSTYFVTFRTAGTEFTESERSAVLDACFHFHNDRAIIRLVTVMPDHVHMLLTPLEREPGEWWSLSDLLHSIKSFTANQINANRGTSGALWQDEFFDRLVRDEPEFREKWNYMLANPVRAGLVDAPGAYEWTRRGEVEGREWKEEGGDDGLEARPTRAGREDNTGDGSMTFHPARYAKTFETWHDNLRDWCISRQLWWGHRIPVWSGRLFMELDKLEIFIQKKQRLIEQDRLADAWGRSLDPNAQASQLHPDGTSKSGSWLSFCIRDERDTEAVELLENAGFTQDPDVLDTWFSSALWPLSTLGWPRADLPLVTPEQIDPLAHPNIQSVWVKRVGTFRDFIGSDQDSSGDLIDRLLHLRDHAITAQGTQPLAYQLFREQDLARDGTNAAPLTDQKSIAEATDLVCAVGIKAEAPLEATKFGVVDIRALLLEHGFQDTAGLLTAFNPTSVLCTAREIITLWVSRMAMFNRFFKAEMAKSQMAKSPNQSTTSGSSILPSGHLPSGDVPFKDVFIHAMIQDGEGRKMSKSLGNGVDPLDIIATHGADAMRFTLAQMTTQTQDVRMPVEPDPETGRNTSPKFDGGRNFCNKLWNAARFTLTILGSGDDSTEPIDPASLPLPDRWILSRLAATTDAIDDALSRYMFKDYADAIYDLLWRDFCDWYLEAIKPTAREHAGQRAALRATLDGILRLLHPIAPFITEAIDEQLRRVPAPPIAGLDHARTKADETLCQSGWPTCASLRDEHAEAEFERVRAAATAIREVRAHMQVKPSRRITLHATGSLAELVSQTGGVIETMAGIETVTADAPTGSATAFTFEGAEYQLSNLADGADAGAEIERLTKQLGDLGKSIKALEGRLSNPGYTQKAPEHLVQQTRDELAAKQAEHDTVQRRLGELG